MALTLYLPYTRVLNDGSTTQGSAPTVKELPAFHTSGVDTIILTSAIQGYPSGAYQWSIDGRWQFLVSWETICRSFFTISEVYVVFPSALELDSPVLPITNSGNSVVTVFKNGTELLDFSLDDSGITISGPVKVQDVFFIIRQSTVKPETQVTTDGIPDAPSANESYVRKTNSWVPLSPLVDQAIDTTLSSYLSAYLPLSGGTVSGVTTFTVRPVFGTATPWDSSNFNPQDYLTLDGATSTYLDKATASSSYLSVNKGGVLSADQTWTGANTFAGTVKAVSFQSYGGVSQLTDAGLTTPNTTTQNLVVSNTVQFSQRPTVNSNLIWDQGNLPSPLSTTVAASSYLPLTGGTLSGPLQVEGTNELVSISGPPGSYRFYSIYTNGVFRWKIGGDTDPENGSNYGTTLNIWRYSDEGALLGSALYIKRDTGVATFDSRPIFGSAVPWDSLNFNPQNYLPLAGGVLSGKLSNGSTGSSTVASAQFSNSDGTGVISAYPNLWGGSYNTLIQTGDSAIVGGSASDGSNGLVLSVWSSTNSGIRITKSSIDLAQRPTFNGNLAWDQGNLDPTTYLPLTGGSLSGSLNIISDLAITSGGNSYVSMVTPNQSVQVFANDGSAGHYGFYNTKTTRNSLSFDMVTDTASFAARPNFAGNLAWDAGNFDPSNYVTTVTAASTYVGKTGSTMTGGLNFTASNTAFRGIGLQFNGVQRWYIGSDTSETGVTNNGSDLNFYAYDDQGGLLGSALTIVRASRQATFNSRPSWGGATPWDSANFDPAQYLTADAAASTYLTPAVAASTYAPIGSISGQPAIISDSYNGPFTVARTMGSNEVILSYVVLKPIVFPANFGGSSCFFFTNCQARTLFNIYSGQTGGASSWEFAQIGGIYVNAGDNMGNFTSTAQVSFTVNPGKVIYILAPETPDNTLGGPVISLLGTWA